MAMAASLQIKNKTGGKILFTQVSQVNDDATWSAPGPGDVLNNDASVTIAMGNSSFLFVRGVGANIGFISEKVFALGQIYFDDPAVGAHSFNFETSGVFNYHVSNPDGNSYIVDISLR